MGAVDTRRAEEQLGERHAVDSGDLLAGPVVPHTPRVRLHGEGGHLRCAVGRRSSELQEERDVEVRLGDEALDLTADPMLDRILIYGEAASYE